MYKRPIRPDELYHYGVLGMHWGVRRYQNYDGTRIGTGGDPVVNKAKLAGDTVAGGLGGKAKGLERLAAASPGTTGNFTMKKDDSAEAKAERKEVAEKVFAPSVKKGKGKEDTSVAQETTKHILEIDRAAKDAVKAVKDSDPRVKEAKEKQEMSLSQKAKKMSDKELRDSINRIKMEREYVSLNKKETQTGYDKAIEVLDKAEPFIKVAAEVAGLVLLLYKLKNNMGHSEDYDPTVDVYWYCFENDFDNDVIVHAMDLDLDYILDYYDLNEEDVQHILDSEEELYHHGVLGMKWGVRRYQNYDGTRIKGGGGSNKASSSFRDTIVGGQGGKATGNARLAASAQPLHSSKTKWHTAPKNTKERRENERLVAEKIKELFGERRPDNEKILMSSEEKQKASEIRKEEIRKGAKAVEKTWTDRENNLNKFYDEIDRLGGYDGENGKNVLAARKKYDTEKYHSIDAITRAAVEKRYSQLPIDDLDDEMIALGKEYGFARHHKGLESYYENGEVNYRVKRR